MVKKEILSTFFIILIIGCTSCSTYDFGGMLTASSSVQQRFEDSMRESEAHFYPQEIICSSDNYSFLVATDTHIKENQWETVDHFFEMAGSSNSLLTVLLGDYLYTAGESLEPLAEAIHLHKDLKMFPAIGNHDVYKDGYQKTYKKTFGPTCYYFKVVTPRTSDLFIILDSANGTLGVDQFHWVERLLSGERDLHRHCFVFTHANFFNPVGYFDVISTYPIEEQMKLLNLFSKHNVTYVFTGHSHLHDETTVRRVKYVTIEAWFEKHEYIRIECDNHGGITMNTQNWDQ